MSELKIAVHQFNPIIGDIDGNIEKIIQAVEIAQKNDADVFITSELAITGYPPKDLLFISKFYRQQITALERLFKFSGITIICGGFYIAENVTQTDILYAQNNSLGACYNSAFVVRDGVILSRYDKKNTTKFWRF